MSKVTYTVHIEPAERGGFDFVVPALSVFHIRSKSKNFIKALEEAKQAIESQVKALKKSGQTVPMESQTIRPLCWPIQVNISGSGRQKTKG